MDELRFLRPLWLLGVAAAPALAWVAWRRIAQLDPWRRACDPTLARVLKLDHHARRRVVPLVLAAALGMLGALALAGPTWDPTEVPVYRSLRARVVVLDLSRSMDVRDVGPSRLERARTKAAALLARSGELQAGLVLFAGDGYLVMPLTSDAAALIGVLPAFDTTVIPIQGSRPDLGLEEAGALIRRSSGAGGEIVLISDGAPGERAVGVSERLRTQGIRVSVLAIGTEEGGPIPLSGGGHLRDRQGRTIVAPTSMSLLRQVARAGGGRFAVSTADDRDLEHLLGAGDLETEDDRNTADRQVRVWRDRGPWLALVLVPLAALGFRRGWVLAVCAWLTLLPPVPGHAQEAVRSEEPERPRAFDWRWQAVDLYRAGRFVDAAQLFANGDEADDHYNRGNALAKAGFLRASVAAYAEALARASDHEDAEFNLELVSRLLRERNPEQQSSRTRAGAEVDAEPLVDTGSGDGSDSGESQGRANDGQGEQASAESREGTEPEQTETTTARPERAPTPDQRAADAERQQPLERLGAAELEAMEETLESVVEDRLGLWRRKIELLWSRRQRPPPDVSDAW